MKGSMQTAVNRVANAHARRAIECPECSKLIGLNNWERHFDAHHPGISIPIFAEVEARLKTNGVPADAPVWQSQVVSKAEPGIDVLDRFNQSINQLIRARDDLVAEKKCLLERAAKIDEALRVLPEQPGGVFKLPDKPVA